MPHKNDYVVHNISAMSPSRGSVVGAAGYEKVACAPITAVLENQNQHYTKVFAKRADANQQRILENIRFAALGIELGDGQPVRVVLEARSAAAATELEKSIEDVSGKGDADQFSFNYNMAVFFFHLVRWQAHGDSFVKEIFWVRGDKISLPPKRVWLK